MSFLKLISRAYITRTEKSQTGNMLHPIQMLLLLLLPLVTPTVSSFGPPSMVVDVDENGRVQFKCMAAGPPEPTFLVKKTKPAPGLWREFESNDSCNISEKQPGS